MYRIPESMIPESMIPKCIYGLLAHDLEEHVISAERDIIPAELAKKIIYLWQVDHLASKVGIETLLEASTLIDVDETSKILRDYGLKDKILLKG